MGINFLCCVHGNEHTKTHDAICDAFVAIAQDACGTRTITCASFNHIQLPLLTSQHYAYQI
jgi:hypothetical protein